jgi:hypothetical protein
MQTNRGNGIDALYGEAGANTLVGGLGNDYLSYGPGVTAPTAVGLGDTDIEAMGMPYDQRVVINLLHRFRDAYGKRWGGLWGRVHSRGWCLIRVFPIPMVAAVAPRVG